MRYLVWKVFPHKFETIAMFDTEEDARSFAEFANATARFGARYEVTKTGETPVW